MKHTPTSSRALCRTLIIVQCVTVSFLTLITHHSSLITVRAQTATATLSGTVTDQNGALVPGVNITLTNTANGQQRVANTDDNGSFTIPLLSPGTYTITAQRDGFYAVQIPSIILNVGDEKSLRFELKVGDVNEMVNITDEASLINESPAVGTIVDRQFVENLPLNGRSFQSLITLTPGVVLTKTVVQDQGQFSVNGQRADANYFIVDGVSANVAASASTQPSQSGAGALPALSASGGTNNLVSVDALQEFKILTSSYAPEFGRMPGAQVLIVTRSGTNQFHGSVFDYFRNDVLDANDWFGNSLRLKKPALRQNDFGGVFGGPLFLPRFGEGGRSVLTDKDRAFFFVSYEGLRLRQPQVASSDVPSLAARAAASPAVQPFINLYPLPNGPNKLNNLATFSASYSNPAELNATSVRIDGNLSERFTLFGRYNHAPSETIGRGGIAQTLNTLTAFRAKTQTFTLGSIQLLSPATSNDLRINFSRHIAESFFELDNFGGAVISPNLFPSGRSSDDSFFNTNITGAALSSAFYGRASSTIQRQFNLVDALSFNKGDHQLKFGFDYRRLSPIFKAPVYSQQYIFSGVGTLTSPATGTLLSGRAQLAAVSSVIGPQTVIFNNFSTYGQDTWQINRRLTLTYGLRWDVNPPPREANGNDPLTLLQVNNPATFAFAPRGTPLWKTTYGNFAPRVGIVFHLNQKHSWDAVLRAGVGIFYDLGNGQASNAFIAGFPYAAIKLAPAAVLPLSATDAAPPVAGVNPTSSDIFYAFDPNLELPRVYQWNFSIEQSLGATQTVTASYVAAVGRKLLRLHSILNPNAILRGNFQITTNNATSDYHAMQIQLQRRLSKGLQALASYTWSHSIDIASSDFLAGTTTLVADPRTDRGPSNFDVRHAFNGALTYNLPHPKAGALVEALMSGWAIDTMFTARSATPVNITYSAAVPGVGNVTLRPDLVAGIPLYLDDPNVAGGRRFNNTQVVIPGNPLPQIGPFLRPTPARQGNLSRNALRGFPVWQWDLALRRQFKLSERVSLQLKGEFFNILNHPNFGDPAGSLNTLSTFGVSTQMLGRSLGIGGLTGGFNPLYQIGGPRSTQLSLKLQF